MKFDVEKLKKQIQERNKELKELRSILKAPKKKGRPSRKDKEKRDEMTKKINDLLRLNREDKKKIERSNKFRDKTNYKTNKQRGCKSKDEIKDVFENKKEDYNSSDVSELKVQEGCIDEYGNLVKPLIDIDVFADKDRFNMAKARPESAQNKINFLKEYIITFGNNALAANRIGKDPDSIYKWLKTDKYFEMLYLEVKNILLDFAEMRLYQLVNVGDLKAIEFFLKTKGKERGYTERIENENTYKDDTININIVNPGDDDDKNDDE
ncbi:MAG: hypothetical protein ACOCRX_07650 [Candidatus Woesearchaeota archaeon]